MKESWSPALHVTEREGGCRLYLEGVACGDGATLQDAADELVSRVFRVATALRGAGLAVPSELPVWSYLDELGELAERGDDLRARVLAG